MEAVLHQTWSENQQTVFLGYLTNSTNVKGCVDGNFVFQQDSAVVNIAFNTVQGLQCKTPNFLFPEL